MSAAQATYVASVQAAAIAQLIARRASAEMARQSAIAAATYVVGKIPGTAAFDATAVSAVKAADVTAKGILTAGEMSKQGTVAKAKAVLADAGEYGY